MLLEYTPCVAALKEYSKKGSYRVMLSASGHKASPERLRKIAAKKHLVLLCGHYEGIDARVEGEVDEVLNVCDLVLTQGILAAMLLIDALARFIPGVLGSHESLAEESFSYFWGEGERRLRSALLEAPHYSLEKGMSSENNPSSQNSCLQQNVSSSEASCSNKEQERPLTPPYLHLLQSGHHEKIEKLRRAQSLERTLARRPDLYSELLQEIEQHLGAREASREGEDPLAPSSTVILFTSSLSSFRRTFLQKLQLPTWEEKGKILAVRIESTILIFLSDPLGPFQGSQSVEASFFPHLVLNVPSSFIERMKNSCRASPKDWLAMGLWTFEDDGAKKSAASFLEKNRRFSIFWKQNER